MSVSHIQWVPRSPFRRYIFNHVAFSKFVEKVRNPKSSSVEFTVIKEESEEKGIFLNDGDSQQREGQALTG